VRQRVNRRKRREFEQKVAKRTKGDLYFWETRSCFGEIRAGRASEIRASFCNNSIDLAELPPASWKRREFEQKVAKRTKGDLNFWEARLCFDDSFTRYCAGVGVPVAGSCFFPPCG
jgi:hypothetical protein